MHPCDSPNRHPLIEVLVERRKTLGLTQSQAAADMPAGYTSSKVRRMERGAGFDPKLSALEAHAAGLGLKLILVPKEWD